MYIIFLYYNSFRQFLEKRGGGEGGRERDVPDPAYSNSCIHLKTHRPSSMDKSGEKNLIIKINCMIKEEYEKERKMTESECKRERGGGERAREEGREIETRGEGDRWKGERPTSTLQQLYPLENTSAELHG